jgi:hypothetical protein
MPGQVGCARDDKGKSNALRERERGRSIGGVSHESFAFSFVILGSRLAEASRERNDRPSVWVTEARVPRISLVIREMWDVTVLDAQLYRCR